MASIAEDRGGGSEGVGIHWTSAFVEALRSWAAAASMEWGYSAPTGIYLEKVLSRVPESIQAWLGKGITDRVILPTGYKFTLAGLKPNKGPYSWFSKSAASQEPAPNWEYFVQVAEFVRLYPLTEIDGVVLDFEDSLMDLSVYKDIALIVCVEVKETAHQLRQLMDSLRTYEERIDRTADDRGNDPIRKAKYIVEKRPRFFCGVAAGLREVYRVEFPEGKEFFLVPDFLPPID